MTRNHLRRRFSLALPAVVFLSFSVLETVELAAVSETLLSLNTEDPQPGLVAPAARSEVAPAVRPENAVYCPKTACARPHGCRRLIDA